MNMDIYYNLSYIIIGGIVTKYVKSTIIGPYHPLLLIIITLGILLMCYISGWIFFMLFYWILENTVIFLTELFNNLKKEHIS